MTDAAYPPLSGERVQQLIDSLMAVQSGHSKPYDPDDMMSFIATTSRVLLALLTDLRDAANR